MPQTIAHFRQHKISKSIGEGFAKFALEQTAVLQYISRESGVPGYLQKLIGDEPTINYYKPEIWNFDNFDVKKLRAWYSNKYLVTLFLQGKKREARDSMMDSIKHGTFQWSRKNLGVMKKILF
jgi:hypothetical protein